MNILLVYPKMPDTFYAMKHFIEVIGKKAAYPPLGLLTVAAMLPKEWNKKLADLNLNDLSNSDLECRKNLYTKLWHNAIKQALR